MQPISCMMNTTDQLKDRIEIRQRELQLKLAALKSDTRDEAIAARDKIENKLDELRDALADGWDHMQDNVRRRLEHWLE